MCRFELANIGAPWRLTNQIYFDDTQLRRGNFFKLPDAGLQAEEGDWYEVGEWIGRGGNAAVYKCQNKISGIEHAIKFFMLHDSYRNKERFLREIELLKIVEDEHITTYHGSGCVEVTHKKGNKTDTIPFVIMELADRNLQELMREKSGPLDYEYYAGQFRGLAGALASLHEHAIHRDIKPENILICGDRWLLSDYGLCSFVSPGGEDLTPEGGNIGPKYWLSPEAHNHRLGCSDDINKSSDVFQLASIFWYVAIGRHPCGILTESDWQGPTKLFGLLYRSLFHDRSKRPQNGAEFFNELEVALSQ